MNTFRLKESFRIPIAVRDVETLCGPGFFRAVKRYDDGTICAAALKPLSTLFPHFAGGAALIPAGADITVERYKEIVDEEQL